jgi:hypothetical protein
VTNTLPTDPPERELKGYAVTTAELRRLADALDTLPPGDKPLYTHVSLLPGETTVEALDAIAVAVTGKPGESTPVGDGKWRRGATMTRDYHFSVGVQGTVPGPPDERDAEIERLRAEVAKLKADTDSTGTVFDREPEELKPTSAPANVEGHAEFTGRASVPDMHARPQCSPACLRAYALKQIVATRHLDDCPVAAAERQSGGE